MEANVQKAVQISAFSEEYIEERTHKQCGGNITQADRSAVIPQGRYGFGWNKSTIKSTITPKPHRPTVQIYRIPIPIFPS